MKIKYHYLGIGLVWAILSLAAGMRWLGQDRDYNNYLIFYELLSSDLSFALEQFRFEPGFVLIAWISINVFGLNFETFLVLVAGIALGVKFFLFSQRPYFWILIVAYIPNLYLLHEMTQIRIAIGMALFYLAVENQFKEKKIWAIALFFLGIMFHASLLIFLPLFFITQLGIAKKRLLNLDFTSYLVLSIVISALALFNFREASQLMEILNPQSTIYIEDIYKFQTVNYFSARNIVLFFLSCIGVIFYKKATYNAKLHIMIGIYGLICFIALSSYPVYSHRLLELCSFSYFLWVTIVSRIYSLIASSLLLTLGFYLGYRQIFIDPIFF